MFYRIILVLALFLLPIIIGPWSFPIVVIIFVLLAYNPVESVLVGIILNSLYYFSENLVFNNWMVVFAVFVYALDFFVSQRITWKKII